MSSGTDDAFKGISLLSAGRLLSLAIQFLWIAVLARLLSPADFGVQTASLLAVGLATAVFDGAFGLSIVQRSSVSADYVSTALWLSMILALVLIGVICAGSGPLSAFFALPDYRFAIVVGSFALLFKAAENVSISYMRRRSRFGSIAAYQTVSAFIGNGPIAIILAWQGYGAWSLVVGQLAASAMSGLGSFALARIPLRFTLRYSDALDVLRSSGHFTLSQVLNWSALAGSTAVVAHSLGVHALGYYSRAWRLLEIATTVSAQPISGVLVPAFARMKDEPSRARNALERALSVAVPTFAAWSALVVVHASAIVAILLGPKWADSVPIVQVLFAVLVPRCCYKITESTIVGFGRSRSAAVRQGLYAALMIGGAVAVARFGAYWVAVNASLAVTAFYLSSLSYACRLVGLSSQCVLNLHVRAAVVTGMIVVVDIAAMSLFSTFWASHCAGVAAALMTLSLVFSVGPRVLLGRHLLGARERIWSRYMAANR